MSFHNFSCPHIITSLIVLVFKKMSFHNIPLNVGIVVLIVLVFKKMSFHNMQKFGMNGIELY